MSWTAIQTWLTTPTISQTFFLATFVAFWYFILYYGSAYFHSIQRRLKQINASTFFGKAKDPFRMIRGSRPNLDSQTVSVVDLNPAFVKRHEKHCPMISLGAYLQSLRPSIISDELPGFLENEINAALALAVVRGLGPTLGVMLLPGTGFFDSLAARLARLAVSLWGRSKQKNNSDVEFLEDRLIDHSGLPLTLYNISYLSELNFQNSKGRGGSTRPSPFEVMCRGEVAGESLFGGTLPKEEEDNHPHQDDMLPNPFKLVDDWQRTIKAMEEKLIKMSKEAKGSSTYEPQSKAMPAPRPIDDRLLPGLELGWGHCLSTHSHREILQNRLLSVLLNRLSTNYLLDRKNELFVVVLEDGRRIVTTEALVEALIDMGHEVEVAVTSHVTTFGVGLCLKEEDGSYTQIPLVAMVENGYSDVRDKKAYTALTHGGLNLDISKGTLLNNVNVQHFISIDGLCGFASNNNVDVPWIRDIDCGARLMGKEALRGIRMAAIQALIVNTVGGDLALPNGGYGLTGVCNDTAAWLEHTMFGKCSIFPVTMSGRFVIHMIRRARELESLFSMKQMTAEVNVTRQLMKSLTELPSDMTSLPSIALDQIRRQLHCMHPEQPFRLMQETERILENVRQEVLYASTAAERNNPIQVKK